jgi:hypothetical protein
MNPERTGAGRCHGRRCYPVCYVEEVWRIVDPVLKVGTPAYEYGPGTWGPREVDQKVSPAGGWHNPMVTA